MTTGIDTAPVDAAPRITRRQSSKVEALFQSAGLPAVIEQRDRDGAFTATFHAPECDGETDAARIWARRIRAAFQGVKITRLYNTYAHWRREGYVLMATVEFVGVPSPKECQP